MIRSRKSLFVCALLLFSVGFVFSNAAVAANSPAQELTKVLPDDVFGFVATSGGDSLKADFEKSILGRMWHDPGVKTFRESIKKELLSKLEQEVDEPDAVAFIDSVRSFAKLVLSRPIIVGVAQKPADDGPPIYGFVILDAGPHKAEIASLLSKLESLDKEGDIVEVEIGSAKMHAPVDADDPPVYWGWVGNYLIVAFNDSDGLAIKHLSAPRATAPGYLKSVPGSGDILAVHADYVKIGAVVKAIAEQEEGEVSEVLGLAMTVLKELGLDKVKSGTARIGFAGPDVISNSLIEIPAPRTGLFASLKTLDIETFDMVHAGAMNATAVNCDLAGVYDTVIGAVKAVVGEEFVDIEQGIEMLEGGLKFKIRDGLLESLSGEMVFYTLGSGLSPQTPTGGFVFIAKLRDAKLLEESLVALGKTAAEMTGGMVQVSSQVQDGRTIHTWAVMPLAMAQIMPTWTIVGDKVVIASSPAISSLAVAQITSPAKSIRDTEEFKRATAELPGNLIALKYSDSKLQFNQVMTTMQQFWPMAAMYAGNAGLKLPFVLPNLSHIAKDMGPSCQYSWFDERGLRSRYRGTGIEPSLGAVVGGGVGAAILMPALARTRQVSKRMQSATHLSGIGTASRVYANDYNDEFPPKLSELIEKAAIDPRMLESPLKPKGFEGPSYVYIAGQNASMRPGNIVVYENPEFSRDGLNVLFMDSHVQWMKKDEFLRELEATYKRLGREMPEIKFKR